MPSNLQFRENVPLAPLTTFNIGGPARFFAQALTEADLTEALSFASTHTLPLFVLGGGSNLLVPDAGYPGLVLHLKIPGIEPLANGLFDVGAYGQEVSETIVSVRVYDRERSAFSDLPKAACNFRYRASLFNTDFPNRYIVTRVRFQLRPNGAPTLHYADLKKHFAANPNPTLTEVAAAVRDIRRSKGMLIDPYDSNDPDSRSAGSFFKNPIVPTAQLPSIAAAANLDTVPNWPTGPTETKLPAAWLLEHAGFIKGYGTGPAGISTRHTLALVNRGHATFADIEALQAEIVSTVHAKFNITLEREPVLLA